MAAGPRHVIDKAKADRIGNYREHDWYGAGRLLQRRHAAGRCQDDVGREPHQFLRILAIAVNLARSPTEVDSQVAAHRPTELLQPLQERCEASLVVGIVRIPRHEHTNPPHPLALLRPCRQRPSRRRAAEKADELASPDHSITSSARASSVGGTSIPSTLAVFMLMIRSIRVACCTGRSAGFSPLRMRPVYVPTIRHDSVLL